MTQSERLVESTAIKPGYYRTAKGQILQVVLVSTLLYWVGGQNFFGSGQFVIYQTPTSSKAVIEWVWKFKVADYKRMSWLEVLWWKITRTLKRAH